MPPSRHSDAPRRSRRISNIPVRNYDEEGFEVYEPEAYSPRHASESIDASYSPHPPPSPSPSECPSLPPSPDEQYTASYTRRASDDHIPRPPNAFMLFRRAWLKRQEHTERDQCKISCMVSVEWNSLSSEEKDVYRRQAHQAKLEHQALYPEYRYAPKARSKPRVQKKRVPRSSQEVSRCKEVAERLMRGEILDHGLESGVSLARSASPAFVGPSLSLSPSVEVKVESPEPELSWDNLYPQRTPATSTSFPVVGHSLQSHSAVDNYTADVELQCPDVVSSEVMDWDAVGLNSFVPMDDIPPIHLPAPALPNFVAPAPLPAVKEESEPESPYSPPRADSPSLPSNREIDNYFGCKHETYNLEPQQTLFTNSSGYPEVSSFSNNDQSEYSYPSCEAQTSTWYEPGSSSYEPGPSSYHANVNFEPADTASYYPQHEAGLSDNQTDFNDDFLYELAQNNPAYLY